MHSMVVVFPAPFGPIRPKISPSYLKRSFIDSHSAAVGLADSGDSNDWTHVVCRFG